MRIREDGVLELRICSGDLSHWCAVCPFVLRNTVIWQTHRLAHAGINRTLNRVRLNWYWPGMTADIRRVIKTCEVCQTAKSGGLHSNRHRHRIHASRPWQKVAIDLVGPMPITSLGNKWILVLTDHFTRWQDAIAIPDATAPPCARILDERVFCYMGLPEQLMQELCMLWGVIKTHTTPYHPQANGVVERGNRGLGDSLRALLLTRGQEEWDLLLPQIMRAFRGTPHSVTGETANMLMLGRELRLPDLVDCNPSEAKTLNPVLPVARESMFMPAERHNQRRAVSEYGNQDSTVVTRGLPPAPMDSLPQGGLGLSLQPHMIWKAYF